MIAQNIPKLEIHWYVTYGAYNQDFPRDLEIDLLTNTSQIMADYRIGTNVFNSHMENCQFEQFSANRVATDS